MGYQMSLPRERNSLECPFHGVRKGLRSFLQSWQSSPTRINLRRAAKPESQPESGQSLFPPGRARRWRMKICKWEISHNTVPSLKTPRFFRQSEAGLTSDKGASDIGPIANPSTYRLNPNVATSIETPKSFWNFMLAGEYPDAAQLTVRSIRMITLTMDHLRHNGQFLGFDMSSGGKTTSSTSVPSCLRSVWRGAEPGSVVSPSA